MDCAESFLFVALPVPKNVKHLAYSSEVFFQKAINIPRKDYSFGLFKHLTQIRDDLKYKSVLCQNIVHVILTFLKAQKRKWNNCFIVCFPH